MRGRGEGEAIAPMIVLLPKTCSSHAGENFKTPVMLMSRLITKLECVQIREKNLPSQVIIKSGNLLLTEK